jgi:hypothetical protein
MLMILKMITPLTLTKKTNTKFMATKYFATPKGIAGYPKLVVPDTKFNADGVYSTKLTLSAEAAKPLIELIEEAFEDEYGAKKLPLLVPPYKADENGDMVFNFKSKNPPNLFDAAGKPVKPNKDMPLGGGSTLKIKGAVGPCLVQGKYYATLWMNAVQIIDMVEYSVGGGFDAVEGGFSADSVVPDRFDDEAATPGANDNQDF